MTGARPDLDQNLRPRHQPPLGGTSLADDKNSTMLEGSTMHPVPSARPRAVSWAMMLCMASEPWSFSWRSSDPSMSFP